VHLVALCPTYGRPSLVSNALALFLAQDLRPDDTAHLVIYDDAGQIATQTGGNGKHTWQVLCLPDREPLQAKYGTMLAYLQAQSMQADAYVVWDDDDIYMPWHLQAHAETLQANQWSHPSSAYSTYQCLHRRPLNARHYHGALAIRFDLMEKLHGWPETDKSNYDQQQLSRCWILAGKPGDPCASLPPSYVYRWADTGRDHCSARIRDGRYRAPRIQEPGQVPILTPAYDTSTLEILSTLAPRR
jgi:hypothetical protein